MNNDVLSKKKSLERQYKFAGLEQYINSFMELNVRCDVSQPT